MKRNKPFALDKQEALHAPGGQGLVAEIVKACSDAKGRRICVLDVKELVGVCDHFIIVSGRSDRQVLGFCSKILRNLEARHVKPEAVEGLDKAHWVLLDFGDVVVHVFYETVREHYDLEGLWSKAKRFDVLEEDGDERSASNVM